MVCVVAPLDQRYVVPELAVSARLVPAQMLTVPAGVIVGLEGSGFTVTTVVPEGTLWHPAVLVTCTV